jgi:DNA-binding CsgD family transcriptional regulator/tetratricopeptide (TPR) repeat protein
MAPAPPAAWPFVGRGLDVDRFLDALANAALEAFVLLGPPGVGKTRLATACLQAAERRGAEILQVIGRPDPGVPLAAVAHLLPPRLDLPDPGSATALDALRLMHTIIQRFAGVPGGGGRRVLLVDDVDLLDPLSATVVAQLVAAGAVFLLATTRLEGGGKARHTAVAERRPPGGPAPMWRRDHAIRVELGNLDRSQVETVLHLAVGGPVDAQTAVAYWTYSAGNPLALRELVLDALERGVLVESGGVWRLTGPLLGGGRADALAASRLGRLDERERELLELLVVAHELGLADLEARYPAEVLESLEDAGLIAVRADGRRLRVGPAHPLYEETIRTGMSSLRARRRRRTVIEIIESHGARRREDRVTAAVLRLDNNEPADPVLLLRAAWLALHARDHVQAERLARAAHDVAPSAVALQLWAEALHELGRHEESLAVLDTAPVDLAPEERLALGLSRANTLYWGLGQPDQALRVLSELSAEPELAGHRWAVDVNRATLAGYLGDVAMADALLADAAPRGVESGAVGLVRHTVQLMAGRVQEALDTAQAAYEASSSSSTGTGPHPGIHLVNVVTALIELGRFDAAEALVGPLYDEAAVEHLDTVQRWGAVARGRLEVRRWAALARGHLELDRGRLHAAERWFREAAEEQTGPVLPRAHRLALAGVAIAAGMRAASAVAAQAIERLDSIPGDSRAVWDISYDRGRAWAAAARGDVTAGRAILEAAAGRARRTGRLLLEAQAWHGWLQLGGVGPELDRLIELGGLVDTPIAALTAAHARAVRAGDPEGLERVAAEFARLGYLLYAAEAAEQAATLFRHEQQQRHAIACHNRSMVLRARCEGPRTPLLSSVVDAETLSRREHEIALLVAAGETNKAISQRLFLSVRTVENHVQRVLTKLGCTRRSEIATALGLGPESP